jgi:hypothetical protein
MSPGDFWSATMDECILTYMGKVNDWRVQRMIAVAMMKHGAGEKVSPLEDVPLAFDDELESRSSDQDLIEEYKRLNGVVNG